MDWISYVSSGQIKRDIKQLIAMVANLTQLTQQGFIRMTQSISDVDAALTANDTAISSLASALETLNTTATQTKSDVDALAAKVTASAPDLTPEVEQIQKQSTALANLATALNTALATVQKADADATGTTTTEPTDNPAPDAPAS